MDSAPLNPRNRLTSRGTLPETAPKARIERVFFQQACYLTVKSYLRPVRESNPCRQGEREAIYRNSKETCGMDSTVKSSKVL